MKYLLMIILVLRGENMITVKMVIDRAKNNKDSIFIFDDETKTVLDKETNEPICSYEIYTKWVKEHIGISFKSLYHCHADLTNILECTKCGTIIFTREDEEYDPILRCPVCTDYKTSFKYYTKDQVESDQELSTSIQFYKDWQREMDLDYEFEKKRGKYNSEIFSFMISNVKIIIGCDNVRKSYFKGLHINIWVREPADNNTTKMIWKTKIPLTPKGIRYRILYLLRRNKI